MSSPIFEADSIGIRYGERRVLTSASLRAHEGRITALFGRNGVGKSSLIRAAVGLQPYEHGIVRFAGRYLERPPLPKLARRGLFFLPDREILDPTSPVRWQLGAMERRFDGVPVEEAARVVDLQSRLDDRVENLSGGELRRAEIALALVRQPRCLIADEPFRGIPPRDAETIAGAFRALADRGAAVVITGHEVNAIRDIADAVVWCVAGTTHEYPSAALAWDDPQFCRDYLGVVG